MRVILFRFLNLLVLGTILTGVEVSSTFLTLPVQHRTHCAQSLACTAHEWKSEPRSQQVSQANTPVTKERGETIYQGFCSACHGTTRAGVPSVFPTLIDINKRQSDAEIASQVRHGKGRMPAFPDMSDDDLKALLLFLKTPPQTDLSKPSTIDSAGCFGTLTRSRALI